MLRIQKFFLLLWCNITIIANIFVIDPFLGDKNKQAQLWNCAIVS